MQRGVAMGLKVPCLFMITEVSIRCQKTRRLVYGVRIPAYTPQYTTAVSRLLVKKVNFSHTRYQALGPELIPVYRQSARR